MRRHLFWLLVAVVAGVFAHAAFALFVPGWWFSREVRQLAHDHGKNSFFILSPQEQAKLFPGLPRFGVTGVCVFDVARGDVTFAANLEGLLTTSGAGHIRFWKMANTFLLRRNKSDG